MPESVKIELRFDGAAFARAIDEAQKAFARMGERIADAVRAMAPLGRNMADVRFIGDGGRFYWVIVTCDDGVTRSVRRRDLRGWRR